MSPDEQKELKGRVLVEYQEVEDLINLLEAQAKSIGDDISAFGHMLQNGPAQNVFRHNQSHHDVAVASYVSEKIQKSMRDWEKCFDLADELRQAYNRRRELTDQKQRLGLR
jgi:hypothetical protein